MTSKEVDGVPYYKVPMVNGCEGCVADFQNLTGEAQKLHQELCRDLGNCADVIWVTEPEYIIRRMKGSAA